MKSSFRPYLNSVQGFPTFAPTSAPSRIPRDEDITYHNGTVLVGPTLTIYNIYYGHFTNTTMDLIDYFARSVVNHVLVCTPPGVLGWCALLFALLLGI